MKMEVVGISTRRAGTAKSGKPYDFAYLYCKHKAEEVLGDKTEEIYLNYRSPMNFPEFQIGDIVNIGYDRSGYLEEISVVEKSKASSNPANLKINPGN